MRILFLNHNLRGYGTWFRAIAMARALVERGHTAMVFTASPQHWYRPVEAVYHGVRVVECPSWSCWLGADDGWSPTDLLYRLLRVPREAFDLIYAFAHPPTVYYPARWGQLLRGRPLVVDWCDYYAGGVHALREAARGAAGARGFGPWLMRRAEAFERRLERRILQKAQAVTVISNGLGRLARDAGVPADRLLRVPSGACWSLQPPLDKAACRARFGLPLNDPLLAYVANYNPDEALLLEALDLAFDRHPQARLVARCPEFSPTALASMRHADRILYLPRCSCEEVFPTLCAADACLLPMSDHPHNWMRWPQKFSDYLSVGRPLLSNAVGDTAAYYQGDGANRIGLASPANPQAYGKDICEFLDHPEWWGAMGSRARELADTDLNWPALIKPVERLLLDVLDGPLA